MPVGVYLVLELCWLFMVSVTSGNTFTQSLVSSIFKKIFIHWRKKDIMVCFENVAIFFKWFTMNKMSLLFEMVRVVKHDRHQNTRINQDTIFSKSTGVKDAKDSAGLSTKHQWFITKQTILVKSVRNLA